MMEEEVKGVMGEGEEEEEGKESALMLLLLVSQVAQMKRGAGERGTLSHAEQAAALGDVAGASERAGGFGKGAPP